MDELMKDLDDGLRAINEKIPNINQGGCGVFAIYLWDELIQLGLTTQVIVFTDRAPVYSIYHVILKHGDLYIDSEGIHYDREEKSYAIETVMPLDVLQVEAFDDGLWADRFDRDYIPEMKKELHRLGARLLSKQRQKDLAVSF